MKKQLFVLSIGLVLCAILWGGAASLALSTLSTLEDAPESADPGIPNSNKAWIFDGAQLLSGAERENVSLALRALQDKYGLDVVIVTTRGVGDGTNQSYADDYYDFNGFADDGVCLLINTAPNGWHISTAGAGIRYFTDDGIAAIGDHIRGDLSGGRWERAFLTFAEDAGLFIQQGMSGKPFDTDNPFQSPGDKARKTRTTITAMIWLSLAIAILFVRILAAMMHTVRSQSSAKAYEHGFHLTRQRDVFLYRTTLTEQISNDSGAGGGSSGGGSSTHASSSGRTHGGGGGGF